MIPSDLQVMLDSLDFEEDGGVLLRSAEWSEDAFRLGLEFRSGRAGDPAQPWTVACHSVREQFLSFEWASTLSQEQDHPRLWPYLKDTGSLSFNSLDTDSSKLIGDLYVAHLNVAGYHFPLTHFINSGLSIRNLGTSSFGLFAGGPLVLLEAYRKVLEAHGAKCSIRMGSPAKPQTEDGGTTKTNTPQMLLFGDSFVIAERFEFERKCV